MSIAITEDHRALAQTVSDFLTQRRARGEARALLEGQGGELPPFWKEVGQLGWLGLHIPEELGGSGFGIVEAAIVAEEMGRAIAHGPFLPTVAAGAVLVAAGSPAVQSRWLPSLADGSAVGAVALGGSVTISGGRGSGSADVVA